MTAEEIKAKLLANLGKMRPPLSREDHERRRIEGERIRDLLFENAGKDPFEMAIAEEVHAILMERMDDKWPTDSPVSLIDAVSYAVGIHVKLTPLAVHIHDNIGDVNYASVLANGAERYLMEMLSQLKNAKSLAAEKK
jgi:hypothetical protein